MSLQMKSSCLYFARQLIVNQNFCVIVNVVVLGHVTRQHYAAF